MNSSRDSRDARDKCIYMAHSDGFAFGIVLGVAGGVALTVGSVGFFKRWISGGGPQTGADTQSLVESVNGLANELRQLRSLAGSLERHIESFLGSYERDRHATEAGRREGAHAYDQGVFEDEHKRERQAVSTTVGVNNDVVDGEESSSDDSEFYEMPGEFPAAEGNLKER